MKSINSLHFIIFSLMSISLHSQKEVINIWPNLAPGSENVENNEEWRNGKSVINVYQPELTLFLPKKSNQPTAAMLVFPGGGYRQVVMEKEGYKVAKWLNDNNIAAFVLKYRLNKKHALRDAQRAMSLLRSKSSDYNIDIDKIGAIGFSAGAHLACNLTMNYDQKAKSDATDDFSSKPDFWIGIYGSYEQFLEDDIEAFSSDTTTPAFLVHAGNDSKVPVNSSLEMYSYLKQGGVPAELHIYEQGEHGFALETNRGEAVTSTVKDWSRRCLDWLKTKGILQR